MKFTITTEDEQEARRIAKSENMAFFFWDLVHNTREGLEFLCESDDQSIVIDAIYDKINELLDHYLIVIDDLTE